MMEMVSNSRIHEDIGTTTRNKGARCSKRILDGMCLQMATTSFANNNNNNIKKSSCLYDRDGCHPFPCTSSSCQINDENFLSTSAIRHPIISIIGPLFAPDDFEMLKPLGEGFFSKVFKVRHINSGEVLVLKESKPTGTCRRTTHIDAAREARIMRRLKHDNVLELRGICISLDECGKWDANLLFTYCEGGSLSSLILDYQKTLTWQRRVQYALDIARAMEYIHSQNIIHRDLTSSNVLIQTDNFHSDNGWGRAVVADFGLSCQFPERGEKLAQVGTTYFMSPECLKEEYYDAKSDVFSFGIILCQMIARIDVDPDGGIPRTSKFGFDYVLFTPLCPLDTPIELLKLAFNSCVMDPAARPTFTEARLKLVEILSVLPAPILNKSFEILRDGKESRLGRSRSDAALKRPKSLQASRKLSTNYNVARTVNEGEVDDNTHVHQIEALARDIVRDEPDFYHVNPFRGHERFRTERKILPKKGESSQRRSHDGKVNIAPKDSREEVMNGTPRRRCFSMPSVVDVSSEVGHYSSFSYDGSCGIEESMDSSDYIDVNSSPASGIPMAYRDFDRSFLKQMTRFPSRRHTMMPDCVGKASFDAMSDDSSKTKSRRPSMREMDMAENDGPPKMSLCSRLTMLNQLSDDDSAIEIMKPLEKKETIIRNQSETALECQMKRAGCSAVTHRAANDCCIL